MTAALKNRVRPVVGSLALGSTLVLSGCVTDLTGIGAGSDFACPMDDGTLCASMADISQMSRRGELPWEQRREAARARAEAEGLDAANASGGSTAQGDSTDSTSDQASPDEQPARVKGVANAVSAADSTESSDNASGHSTSSAKAAPAKGASAAEAVASAEAAEAPEAELRPGFRPNRPLPARMTESWGRSPLTAWATPERTPERLVRIFVAPWTDRDGDLHDAHYVYAAVTPPEWNTARRRRPDGRAVVKLPFELNRPARTDRTREVENLDAAYGAYGTYGEFDAVRVDDVKDPFGYPADAASETDANWSGAERLRADRARQLSAARKLAAPAAAFGGVDSPDASEASGTSGSATPEAPDVSPKPDAS